MTDSEDLAIDKRLQAAFDRALTALDQDLDSDRRMFNRIMRRVRRRQRLRTVILLGAGFVAALVAVVNGLPLIVTATEALSSVSTGQWTAQLPTILAGAAVVFGCVAFFQMLIEDDV